MDYFRNTRSWYIEPYGQLISFQTKDDNLSQWWLGDEQLHIYAALEVYVGWWVGVEVGGDGESFGVGGWW